MNPPQQFIGTPGPWEFDSDSQQIISKHPAVIATVMMPDDFPCVEDKESCLAECEANANVLTAAPELLKFAQWAESRQPEMLKMIEANKFVFKDIGNEPGNWQHLAFTLYTELCALNEMARHAIAKATKGDS